MGELRGGLFRPALFDPLNEALLGASKDVARKLASALKVSLGLG
jgi:hypothetical protein